MFYPRPNRPKAGFGSLLLFILIAAIIGSCGLETPNDDDTESISSNIQQTNN